MSYQPATPEVAWFAARTTLCQSQGLRIWPQHTDFLYETSPNLHSKEILFALRLSRTKNVSCGGEIIRKVHVRGGTIQYSICRLGLDILVSLLYRNIQRPVSRFIGSPSSFHLSPLPPPPYLSSIHVSLIFTHSPTPPPFFPCLPFMFFFNIHPHFHLPPSSLLLYLSLIHLSLIFTHSPTLLSPFHGRSAKFRNYI